MFLYYHKKGLQVSLAPFTDKAWYENGNHKA